MPQDSATFPRTFVATTKSVSSLVLRSTARPAPILRNAFFGASHGVGNFLFFDELFPLRAHEQIFPRLFVQARQIVILESFFHYAPSRFRAEVVLRIELLHPLD